MKAPYDIKLQIDNIFDQVKDGVEFSDAVNFPYTPTQVLNTAFNVLF